jgi:hypothetical protein
MNRNLFSLIRGGLALCICTGLWPLQAQVPDDDPTATITFDSNQSVAVNSNGRVFDLVGLQPSETVAITVQFSTQIAGHILEVEPRDGGCVSSGTSTLLVADDGTISFQFQGGFSPGRYQVSIRDGAQEIALQFWVLDLANPQNNPRVVTPDNPNI